MAHLEIDPSLMTNLSNILNDEIKLIMERILVESQGEVPVASGDLKLSGQVYTNPSTGVSGVSYYAVSEPTMKNPLGYNYAYRQHEDLSLSHTVGKAKFLSSPANRILQQYINSEAKNRIEKRVFTELRPFK